MNVEPPDPQQDLLNQIQQVSEQNKAPTRQAISQLEEIVLGTISNITSQLVVFQVQNNQLIEENKKLKEQCEKNKKSKSK